MYNDTLPKRACSIAAFTLVELLVVVSIIALLLSILLPSLNKARDAARGVQCLSLFRQLGLANQFYTDDFNGWCVPPGNWSASRCIYGNSAFLTYLSIKAYTGTDGLWSHWYWPRNMLCPSSNAGAYPHPTQAGYYLAPTSWGINTQSMGAMSPAYYVRRRGIEPLPGGASTHVLYLDHVSLEAPQWSGSPISYATYGEYGGHPTDNTDGGKRVAYRHLGNANVLFYDGHAAAMSADELYDNGSDNAMNMHWIQK